MKYCSATSSTLIILLTVVGIFSSDLLSKDRRILGIVDGQGGQGQTMYLFNRTFNFSAIPENDPSARDQLLAELEIPQYITALEIYKCNFIGRPGNIVIQIAGVRGVTITESFFEDGFELWFIGSSDTYVQGQQGVQLYLQENTFIDAPIIFNECYLSTFGDFLYVSYNQFIQTGKPLQLPFSGGMILGKLNSTFEPIPLVDPTSPLGFREYPAQIYGAAIIMSPLNVGTAYEETGVEFSFCTDRFAELSPPTAQFSNNRFNGNVGGPYGPNGLPTTVPEVARTNRTMMTFFLGFLTGGGLTQVQVYPAVTDLDQLYAAGYQQTVWEKFVGSLNQLFTYVPKYVDVFPPLLTTLRAMEARLPPPPQQQIQSLPNSYLTIGSVNISANTFFMEAQERSHSAMFHFNPAPDEEFLVSCLTISANQFEIVSNSGQIYPPASEAGGPIPSPISNGIVANSSGEVSRYVFHFGSSPIVAEFYRLGMVVSSLNPRGGAVPPPNSTTAVMPGGKFLISNNQFSIGSVAAIDEGFLNMQTRVYLFHMMFNRFKLFGAPSWLLTQGGAGAARFQFDFKQNTIQEMHAGIHCFVLYFSSSPPAEQFLFPSPKKFELELLSLSSQAAMNIEELQVVPSPTTGPYQPGNIVAGPSTASFAPAADRLINIGAAGLFQVRAPAADPSAEGRGWDSNFPPPPAVSIRLSSFLSFSGNQFGIFHNGFDYGQSALGSFFAVFGGLGDAIQLSGTSAVQMTYNVVNVASASNGLGQKWFCGSTPNAKGYGWRGAESNQPYQCEQVPEANEGCWPLNLQTCCFESHPTAIYHSVSGKAVLLDLSSLAFQDPTAQILKTDFASLVTFQPALSSQCDPSYYSSHAFASRWLLEAFSLSTVICSTGSAGILSYNQASGMHFASGSVWLQQNSSIRMLSDRTPSFNPVEPYVNYSKIQISTDYAGAGTSLSVLGTDERVQFKILLGSSLVVASDIILNLNMKTSGGVSLAKLSFQASSIELAVSTPELFPSGLGHEFGAWSALSVGSLCSGFKSSYEGGCSLRSIVAPNTSTSVTNSSQPNYQTRWSYFDISGGQRKEFALSGLIIFEGNVSFRVGSNLIAFLGTQVVYFSSTVMASPVLIQFGTFWSEFTMAEFRISSLLLMGNANFSFSVAASDGVRGVAPPSLINFGGLNLFEDQAGISLSGLRVTNAVLILAQATGGLESQQNRCRLRFYLRAFLILTNNYVHREDQSLPVVVQCNTVAGLLQLGAFVFDDQNFAPARQLERVLSFEFGLYSQLIMSNNALADRLHGISGVTRSSISVDSVSQIKISFNAFTGSALSLTNTSFGNYIPGAYGTEVSATSVFGSIVLNNNIFLHPDEDSPLRIDTEYPQTLYTCYRKLNSQKAMFAWGRPAPVAKVPGSTSGTARPQLRFTSRCNWIAAHNQSKLDREVGLLGPMRTVPFDADTGSSVALNDTGKKGTTTTPSPASSADRGVNFTSGNAWGSQELFPFLASSEVVNNSVFFQSCDSPCGTPDGTPGEESGGQIESRDFSSSNGEEQIVEKGGDAIFCSPWVYSFVSVVNNSRAPGVLVPVEPTRDSARLSTLFATKRYFANGTKNSEEQSADCLCVSELCNGTVVEGIFSFPVNLGGSGCNPASPLKTQDQGVFLTSNKSIYIPRSVIIDNNTITDPPTTGGGAGSDQSSLLLTLSYGGMGLIAILLLGGIIGAVVRNSRKEKEKQARRERYRKLREKGKEALQRLTQWSDLKPTALSFKKGKMIGSGGFGKVYVGLDENTGRLLAAKEIDLTSDFDAEKTEKSIGREIALMKKLNHPHVVKYLGADRPRLAGSRASGAGSGGDSKKGSRNSEEDNNKDASSSGGNGTSSGREATKEKSHQGVISFCIFMEYLPGGSLRSIIKSYGKLKPKLAAHYTAQAAAGLAYLHSQKVVHRDIKAENMLMDRDGVLKLADMGCAQNVDSISSGMRGTPLWMAPEVLRGDSRPTTSTSSSSASSSKGKKSSGSGGDGNSKKSAGKVSPGAQKSSVSSKSDVNQYLGGVGAPSDIWALGCTVMEMLTGKNPFDWTGSPVVALMRLVADGGEPLEQAWDSAPASLRQDPDGYAFVRQACAFDPYDRPTAEELLKHPFLKDTVSPLAPNTGGNSNPATGGGAPIRGAGVGEGAVPGDLAQEMSFDPTSGNFAQSNEMVEFSPKGGEEALDQPLLALQEEEEPPEHEDRRLAADHGSALSLAQSEGYGLDHQTCRTGQAFHHEEGGEEQYCSQTWAVNSSLAQNTLKGLLNVDDKRFDAESMNHTLDGIRNGFLPQLTEEEFLRKEQGSADGELSIFGGLSVNLTKFDGADVEAAAEEGFLDAAEEEESNGSDFDV